MAGQTYYITLPIYYANGSVHIGHAYTSLIGDTIARYRRLMGDEVKFSVGTDENSQKIVQKAVEKGKDIMEFLDELAQEHKKVRDALQISYTDFIRTTEPRHRKFVQQMLERAHQAGDLYQRAYHGLYCVGCEGFKKESDLTVSTGEHGRPKGEKICPDHPHMQIQQLEENNWFFKLSSYQSYLEEFYKENPDFIVPHFRYHEVTSFVQQGLEDFSISRENANFGIPLPFDPQHITYVWFDALLNYNTLCQDPASEKFRPADLQVMGKDIIRFHSIYYPAMLKSLNITPPRQQLINGFLTINGQKMSKSLGNGIDPRDIIQSHGRDALLFYFLYDIKIGNDGDVSMDRMNDIYTSMLAGGRGNLVSRVTKLAAKNNINSIEADDFMSEHKRVCTLAREEHGESVLLTARAQQDIQPVFTHYLEENIDLQGLIKDRYSLIQTANKHLNDTAPWKLLKDENTEKQAHVTLGYMLLAIQQLNEVSSAFLLEGSQKVADILGQKLPSTTHSNTAYKLWDKQDMSFSLTPSIVYPPLPRSDS